jgi:hypothetical protein
LAYVHRPVAPDGHVSRVSMEDHQPRRRGRSWLPEARCSFGGGRSRLAAPGPRGARPHVSRYATWRWSDPRETCRLDEDLAPLDRVAVGVELVPVEPAPAMVGGAFIDVDHSDSDRRLRGELHAGPRADVDHVSRPRWPRGRAPRRGRQLNLPVPVRHIGHSATSASRCGCPGAGPYSEEVHATPPAPASLLVESLAGAPG